MNQRKASTSFLSHPVPAISSLLAFGRCCTARRIRNCVLSLQCHRECDCRETYWLWSQWFSTGKTLLLEAAGGHLDIWRCRETLLVVTNGVGRGWRRGVTSLQWVEARTTDLIYLEKATQGTQGKQCCLRLICMLTNKGQHNILIYLYYFHKYIF